MGRFFARLPCYIGLHRLEMRSWFRGLVFWRCYVCGKKFTEHRALEGD